MWSLWWVACHDHVNPAVQVWQIIRGVILAKVLDVGQIAYSIQKIAARQAVGYPCRHDLEPARCRPEQGLDHLERPLVSQYAEPANSNDVDRVLRERTAC